MGESAGEGVGLRVYPSNLAFEGEEGELAEDDVGGEAGGLDENVGWGFFVLAESGEDFGLVGSEGYRCWMGGVRGRMLEVRCQM